jgi:hypothetical protein
MSGSLRGIGKASELLRKRSSILPECPAVDTEEAKKLRS